MYDDLLKDLKPHDYYFAISNIAEWQSLDEDFFLKEHVEKRIPMRLETKLLFVDSAIAQERKKTERNFSEEVKLLPKETDMHVDLVVTPYKLVMFQLKLPLMAIVIENHSMVEMHKSLFELLWEKY
mgnify:CR=1 FL=1